MKRYVVLPWLGGLLVASGFWLLFGAGSSAAVAGQVEVPSLTQWGKIYALLLLAALGVAYLVWRRPIMQAQAVLETSPLGEKSPPLVDWSSYLKLLVIMEIVAGGVIGILMQSGMAIDGINTIGALGATAIVAFVVHLLWLARSSDGQR